MRRILMFILCYGVMTNCLPVVRADIPRGYFAAPRAVFQNDFHPHSPWVSEDGLRLYYADDRTLGEWDPPATDIFVATRQSTNDPAFSRPVSLGDVINTKGASDCCFTLSTDELTLIYESGLGQLGELNERYDTLVSKRTSIESPWQEPVPLFPENYAEGILESVNDVELSSDGLRAYFTGTDLDTAEIAVYSARRDNVHKGFSDPTQIVFDPQGSRNQSLSSDELTVFYRTELSGPWVRAATRNGLDEPFGEPIPAESLGYGSGSPWIRSWTPYVSRDWPAPGSQLYLGQTVDWTLSAATWILLGDTNQNSMFDAGDFDRLALRVRLGRYQRRFDVNEDKAVDVADQEYWVHSIAQTWFGDADLDGEFNSGDLVAVFTGGEYEDGVPMNSGWATGDWNGDAEFGTGDLVLAFQDGGFEQGPRPAAHAVPEPASLLILVAGLVGISVSRRNSHQ